IIRAALASASGPGISPRAVAARPSRRPISKGVSGCGRGPGFLPVRAFIETVSLSAPASQSRPGQVATAGCVELAEQRDCCSPDVGQVAGLERGPGGCDAPGGARCNTRTQGCPPAVAPPGRVSDNPGRTLGEVGAQGDHDVWFPGREGWPGSSTAPPSAH